MSLCRIDLTKTDYTILDSACLQRDPSNILPELYKVFKQYCEYKQFKSVQPLFDIEFLSNETDVITYNNFSAFSIIRKYDCENAEAIQFAWNYKNPKLRLGIRSLEHECAFYKSLGYRYLYLGDTAPYKTKIRGYEELGPL